MDEPVLVEFLRHDPIRGGRWYRHRDGDSVHEYVSGGHVWRQHTPMSERCVFCEGVFQKTTDPTWAKCSQRPPTGTPAWPTPLNSQFPNRRPPLASLPFPSTVARSLIVVEELPAPGVAIYDDTGTSS